MCVPELPARPANANLNNTSYFYKSTFLNTILIANYSKGHASFKSDSLATISVLRDTISREATARVMQVQMNVEVKNDSHGHVLSLIHPKLAFQMGLSKQVRLIEPLREILLQEESSLIDG